MAGSESRRPRMAVFEVTTEGLGVHGYPWPRINQELHGLAEHLTFIHIQLVRYESAGQAEQKDARNEQRNRNRRGGKAQMPCLVVHRNEDDLITDQTP